MNRVLLQGGRVIDPAPGLASNLPARLSSIAAAGWYFPD
jgi:hypothetical protein